MVKPELGPLFIIGKPRSGTKLLARIFEQHPDIAMEVSETGFIPYYLNRPELINNLNIKSNFIKFYNSVIKIPYFSVYHTNLIDVNEWYDLCTDYSFYNVLEVLIKYYTNNLDKPNAIWGDKTNGYITHVKLIKNHFSYSKFIHIVRDVRDASLSSYNAWGTNIYRYSQRWFNDINQLNRDLKQLSIDDYVEIKYEELLQEPAKIIKRCLNMLNLEFFDDLLNLKKQSEAVGDARGLKIIKSDNYEKYKKHYSENQILKIEKITWPLLKKYGYAHQYEGKLNKISGFMITCYQMSDIINRLKFDIRKFGIKNLLKIIKRGFNQFKMIKSVDMKAR